MKIRIAASIALFAASFILEKVAEKVFPFGELIAMAMPKKA